MTKVGFHDYRFSFSICGGGFIVRLVLLFLPFILLGSLSGFTLATVAGFFFTIFCTFWSFQSRKNEKFRRGLVELILAAITRRESPFRIRNLLAVSSVVAVVACILVTLREDIAKVHLS